MPPLATRRLLLSLRVSPPLLLVLSSRQAGDHVRQRLVEVRREIIDHRGRPVVPFRDREPVQHMCFRRDRSPGPSQEVVGVSLDGVRVFGPRLLSKTLS